MDHLHLCQMPLNSHVSYVLVHSRRSPIVFSPLQGSRQYLRIHIGVDAESGLTLTLVVTPANSAHVTLADQLVHGQDRYVFGDTGCRGVERRRGTDQKRPSWHVAMHLCKRSELPDPPLGPVLARIEQYIASVRAKVEHSFNIINSHLGLKKVR